jgi:hypothetical protein
MWRLGHKGLPPVLSYSTLRSSGIGVPTRRPFSRRVWIIHESDFLNSCQSFPPSKKRQFCIFLGWTGLILMNLRCTTMGHVDAGIQAFHPLDHPVVYHSVEVTAAFLDFLFDFKSWLKIHSSSSFWKVRYNWTWSWNNFIMRLANGFPHELHVTSSYLKLQVLHACKFSYRMLEKYQPLA